MQSAAACDSHRFVNLPAVVRYESFGRARPARAWRFRFQAAAARCARHRIDLRARRARNSRSSNRPATPTRCAPRQRAWVEQRSSGHRAAVRPAGSHRLIRDVVFSRHRSTPRHPLSRTNSVIAHAAPSRFSTSNPKPGQSGLTRITSRINGIFTKTILNNPNEYPEKFNVSGAAAPARAAHRTAAHRTQPRPAYPPANSTLPRAHALDVDGEPHAAHRTISDSSPTSDSIHTETMKY